MAEQPKPLWEVCEDSLQPWPPRASAAEGLRLDYAATFRAIANKILPEEAEPPCGEREPWPDSYQLMSDAKWEQRMATRQRLLDEADRAEKGEVE